MMLLLMLLFQQWLMVHFVYEMSPSQRLESLVKSAQFPHLYNLAHSKADIFPEFDKGAEDNQKITLPQSSFICVPRRAIPEIDFYSQSNHNKQIIKSMAKS